MKLVGGGMRAFALPLGRPLATAHGSIERREGVLLRLVDGEGEAGFGEATPLPEFGTEGLDRSRSTLERGVGRLLEHGELSLAEALEIVGRECLAAPCARFALETALHDLCARRQSIGLASWLRRQAGGGGEPARRVVVQALVGGVAPVEVERSAREALDRGFGTFKLKLAVAPGAGDPAADLERVAALRAVIGEERRIRLDANEAWTRSQAEPALQALARFGIEYVEQPVARSDLEGLRALDRDGPIPVAADEALLGAGLEACLERRAAGILILKPAALGGPTPAAQLVARAAELSLRVVWSSLIDGAVARAAAAAMAAALGPAQEVHGLGTGPLLDRDLCPGAALREGAIELDDAPGLGPGPEQAWHDEHESWGARWSVGSVP